MEGMAAMTTQQAIPGESHRNPGKIGNVLVRDQLNYCLDSRLLYHHFLWFLWAPKKLCECSGWWSDVASKFWTYKRWLNTGQTNINHSTTYCFYLPTLHFALDHYHNVWLCRCSVLSCADLCCDCWVSQRKCAMLALPFSRKACTLETLASSIRFPGSALGNLTILSLLMLPLSINPLVIFLLLTPKPKDPPPLTWPYFLQWSSFLKKTTGLEPVQMLW